MTTIPTLPYKNDEKAREMIIYPYYTSTISQRMVLDNIARYLIRYLCWNVTDIGFYLGILPSLRYPKFSRGARRTLKILTAAPIIARFIVRWTRSQL